MEKNSPQSSTIPVHTKMNVHPLRRDLLMEASEDLVLLDELLLPLSVRMVPNDRERYFASRLVASLQALHERERLLRPVEKRVRPLSAEDDVVEARPSKGKGEGGRGDAKDGGKMGFNSWTGGKSQLKSVRIKHSEGR